MRDISKLITSKNEFIPFLHEDIEKVVEVANDNFYEAVCNPEFLLGILENKDYVKFVDIVANYLESGALAKEQLDLFVSIGLEDEPEAMLDFYHQVSRISNTNPTKYNKISSLITGIAKTYIATSIRGISHISSKSGSLLNRFVDLYKKEEAFISETWKERNFLFYHVESQIKRMLSLHLDQGSYFMMVYIISSNMKAFVPFREVIFSVMDDMNKKRNLIEWSDDAKNIELCYKEICALLDKIYPEDNIYSQLKVIN